MKRRNPRVTAGLIALWLMVPGVAAALPDDRDQPVDLEADRADIDDRSGVSIYTGGVVYVQGSIRMKGDKMTVVAPQGELEKVTIVGRPALYSSVPSVDKERVTATADTIEYFASREEAVLTGNGKIVQGGDTFAGERIYYDMGKDRVRALDDRAKPGEQRSRVKMTFQPKPKK